MSTLQQHRLLTRGRMLPAFSRGFTLVELVMVIVLLGVLAAVAIPKIVGPSVFNTRGFHDQTLAYLRYAQKTAVAQRRTVCVSFTGSSLSLSVASAAGVLSCSANLVGPAGEVPATATAASGTAYSATPSNFNFDGLGQPIDATGTLLGRQTIVVADSGLTITIEAQTGLVHD